MKYTYTLENLNCAHCAGKIEQQIIATEGYENVSFTFATKLLRFDSEKPDCLREIQAICDSIEDGVTVTDAVAKQPHTEKQKGVSVQLILLILAIVLGIAAAVTHFAVTAEWARFLVLGLSAAAALLAGYEVLLNGFKNLFRLRIDESVLMMLAVIAAFCLGEYVEGAAVTILYAVGEMIEDKAVDSSRRNIEKLSQIRPDTAILFAHDRETEVPAESVKVGSTVIVRPHERIPIDGVVVGGSSMLDNAALTGESIPVAVSEGQEVMSGAMNGEGLLTVRTTKAFGDSTATRILRMVEDAAASKGKQEKLISRFAAVYTPIIVGIAVLIAVLPPLFGLGSFADWIYKALVVLVASCPCAIVISVPLSYYAGIGAASRSGVLIKGGKYLEALAGADTFVFDKTGTLTTGMLTVTRVTACEGCSEEDILRLAAACEAYSTHPIAEAIRHRAGEAIPALSDYRELAGIGVAARYKDKELCCGSAKILKHIPEHTTSADVYLTLDGKLIGAIELSDTLREEAKPTLAALKAGGVRQLCMLTGDSEKKAAAIAQALSLDSSRAGLLPQEKLQAVEEMKQNAKVLCFVGDGINDAPVLTASDCGIAMGLGSEAAIEAADAVLSAGTLNALPKAVQTAKRTVRTIKTNITFALLVKTAVIVLACLGFASMWMSVLADTGVCVLCVLYASRLLRIK